MRSGAVLVMVFLAAAGVARADVPRPPPLIQEAGACLPTSAAMALHSLSDPTEPRAIARRIPIRPEGADFFDLQEELTRRGYASLVFVGGPADAAAALEAGVPVVAAVHQGDVKHAVMVWGTGADDDGPLLRSTDPARGQERTEDHAAFAARQYGGQLLVLWRLDDSAEARLEAAGFRLEPARRINARFRAQALVRRADRHETVNDQVVELLRRAAAEDPSWLEAGFRLRQAERRLAEGP